MLRIGSFHQEQISFMVLEGSIVDIIMGCLWMSQHTPRVNWNSEEILLWGESCHACISRVLNRPSIPSNQSLSASSSSLPLNSTSIESPETERKAEIPSDYQMFQDVLSKQLATQLPPHRQRHCAIDLQPGATPSKGRVYPLFILEQKAMEDYIEEALRQKFIQSSTSPATSRFFFVAKKDRGLQPCIDYRALNTQMVKYSYPLPLVPAAFGATLWSLHIHQTGSAERIQSHSHM